MPSDLEVDEIKSLLSRHKSQINSDIAESQLLRLLAKKEVLTLEDEQFINGTGEVTDEEKCEKLIEVISKNGYDKFQEFCYSIESEFTKLITDLINDGLNCSKYIPLIVF